MKKTLGITLLIAFTFSLFSSCKKGEANEEVAALTSDASTISSSAAVEKPGSNRKFIRTADLKFKVKNVAKSTYAIENITNHFDGFVIYTNLQSNIIEQVDTKISQDSTLETTRYNVENNITIRVPNKKLDTVLKSIAKEIKFLDYRVIKADDVSLQSISNTLAENRAAKTEKRIEKAIDTKGKKLTDITTAEATLTDKEAQKDNSKLENLALEDKINFSTLTIQLYQNETVQQEMNATTKDYEYYKPNLGMRVIDALQSGWYMLLNLIVFLFEIWWLLLLATGGVFVYKKCFQKKQS
ncbi:hypothetical protein FFWV33_12815 [Flavobacterium faecale]|uniref:DUF4349 domain-containing protein n=1 Tax=Flavobacterium faecale TaxID=1355330 RepID=A0A2S1LIT7_9FLAO|nr:DUF4349 domain-containing protein [Flavobacterium faecale]AWG23649.1 hypothetical protein FFWV33_12815 [Flavobacterium faecale]